LDAGEAHPAGVGGSSVATVGSQVIGKVTELAMKHFRCASTCNDLASTASEPAAMVACGRRAIPEKRPHGLR
jgi:hypothetical protein